MAMTNFTSYGHGYAMGDRQETAFNLEIYVTGRFRDAGCDWSPSCLGCPLPKCVYDLTPAEKNAYRRQRRLIRDQAMAMAVFAGVSPETVADEEGVTVRTVFRAMKRVREAM